MGNAYTEITEQDCLLKGKTFPNLHTMYFFEGLSLQEVLAPSRTIPASW